MCVKLSSEDLNSDPCPPYPTSTYKVYNKHNVCYKVDYQPNYNNKTIEHISI